MTFAARIAPEIDRLVLAVNTASGEASRPRIAELTARIGLDSPALLKHYAEFLLADGISEELMVIRLPYQPAEAVRERVATWKRLDLVVDGGGGSLQATDPLVPLLEQILAERREIATGLWSRHDVLDDALAGAGEVIAGLPEHFRLAVAHRRVPDPDDPCLRLHHRLTTLRYVRAQSHVEAWRGRGLERQEILALTSLWHGKVPDDGPVLAELAERGLVDLSAPALTEEGTQLREAIEEDTNRATEPVFAKLTATQQQVFAEALTDLPGVPI